MESSANCGLLIPLPVPPCPLPIDIRVGCGSPKHKSRTNKFNVVYLLHSNAVLGLHIKCPRKNTKRKHEIHNIHKRIQRIRSTRIEFVVTNWESARNECVADTIETIIRTERALDSNTLTSANIACGIPTFIPTNVSTAIYFFSNISAPVGDIFAATVRQPKRMHSSLSFSDVCVCVLTMSSITLAQVQCNRVKCEFRKRHSNQK